MAADLQRYSEAYVFMDSNLFTQNASVTIEKTGSGQPIHTIGAGFAGVSQGSPVITISLENCVPSKDFEFNPDMFIRSNVIVEVGVVMASRQCVFKGFITDATYTYSVNDAAKISLKIIGRYSDFE
jgi:hypothetical protein